MTAENQKPRVTGSMDASHFIRNVQEQAEAKQIPNRRRRRDLLNLLRETQSPDHVEDATPKFTRPPRDPEHPYAQTFYQHPELTDSQNYICALYLLDYNLVEIATDLLSTNYKIRKDFTDAKKKLQIDLIAAQKKIQQGLLAALPEVNSKKGDQK